MNTFDMFISIEEVLNEDIAIAMKEIAEQEAIEKNRRRIENNNRKTG